MRIIFNGLLLFAVVQTMGAVAKWIILPKWEWPVEIGVSWSLVLLSGLLIFFFFRHKPYKQSFSLSFLVALSIAAAGTIWVNAKLEEVFVVPNLNLYVGKPLSTVLGYGPGQSDVIYSKTNACGLRKASPDHHVDGRPAIAIVGDSFIYGSGVRDEETVADQLAGKMNARGVAYNIENVGIPGTALVSYPNMVRFAERCHHPELFVVYLSESDLDGFDTMSRMYLVQTSLLYQMLSFSNLELVFNAVWHAVKATGYNTADGVAEKLDDLLSATEGKKLLIVSDLVHQDTELLKPWMEQHPEVGWYNASHVPEWNAAEAISPADPHWSPKGSGQIADLLVKPVATMISKGSYRQGKIDLDTLAESGDLAAMLQVAFQNDSAVTPISNDGDLMLRFSVPGEKIFSLRVLWYHSESKCFRRYGDLCLAWDQSMQLTPEEEGVAVRILDTYSEKLKALPRRGLHTEDAAETTGE